MSKLIIPGSSNGRTVAFEAINLGSNPSPGAKQTPAERRAFVIQKNMLGLHHAI